MGINHHCQQTTIVSEFLVLHILGIQVTLTSPVTGPGRNLVKLEDLNSAQPEAHCHAGPGFCTNLQFITGQPVTVFQVCIRHDFRNLTGNLSLVTRYIYIYIYIRSNKKCYVIFKYIHYIIRIIKRFIYLSYLSQYMHKMFGNVTMFPSSSVGLFCNPAEREPQRRVFMYAPKSSLSLKFKFQESQIQS
jgi:hypothetical protein